MTNVKVSTGAQFSTGASYYVKRAHTYEGGRGRSVLSCAPVLSGRYLTRQLGD